MNEFPIGYTPFQQYRPQLPRQEVIRVSGENGAKAYQLPPNSSVLMMDESAPIVWLKTTDGAGYPSLAPYSITPYQPAPPVDINDLNSRLRKVEELLSGVQSNDTNAGK